MNWCKSWESWTSTAGLVTGVALGAVMLLTLGVFREWTQGAGTGSVIQARGAGDFMFVSTLTLRQHLRRLFLIVCSAIVWVAVMAFLTSKASAESVTVRYGQYNGHGPVGSGVYNNFLPISGDNVTFAIKITKIKKWKPGNYNVYQILPNNSELVLWGFEISSDRKLYAALVINDQIEDSATHNLLYCYAGPYNSTENIRFAVRRIPYPYENPVIPFSCQVSYDLINRWEWDAPEFWTGILMTNSYVWPSNNTKVWTVGDNDYPGCSGDCDKCHGMAGYSLDVARGAYSINDTPVTYKVPRGPSPAFTMTYRLEDISQEATLPFTNLGKWWSNSVVSYISGGPAANLETARHYLPGGGFEEYSGFDKSDRGPAHSGTFERGQYSRAKLEWVNDHFVLNRVGGGTKIFSSPDHPGDPACRYFLTDESDAFGNTAHYTYESLPGNAGMRLASITDARGQSLIFLTI